MKKYLLFMMAIISATVARAADGDRFTYEGLNYTILSEADHTVEVSKNDNLSGEIVIPNFVSRDDSRYVVTELGKYAFAACRSMTSVTIPNSVILIGYGAFTECRGLTKVTIPSSVTSIGEGAFENCRGMTKITIPNSVISIHFRAFAGCEGLTKVTIPNSVIEIGDYAFLDCSELTSVIIPNSVNSIGVGPFAWCTKLKEIIVESGNEYYCSDNGALYNYNMTELVQVPRAKKEFAIPNSVISIGECAFLGCTFLTSVTIPASVTEIGESAFSFCSRLTKIIDLNPTPPKVGSDSYSSFYDVPSDAVVYIPKGSSESYMVADGWTQFSDFREMGAFDIIISASTLELTLGETAELTVSVVKDDDVTVGDHKWVSSNPEAATVEDGKVTAIAPGTADITYTVYDEYGVAHSESCKVTVKDPSGVQDIDNNASAVVDVFNMNGFQLLRNATEADIDALPAGIYIVPQGGTAKKIAVK